MRVGGSLTFSDRLQPPESLTMEDKIKAATAYCLYVSKDPMDPEWFPWSVGGFRALCEIKSSAVMARDQRDLPPRALTEDVLSNEDVD